MDVGGYAKKLRYVSARMFINEIGENVNIEKGAQISSMIKIGNNSGIGVNSFIQGTVIIGNDVMMGSECLVYTRNHQFSNLSIPMWAQGLSNEKPVIIGDDVWIG